MGIRTITREALKAKIDLGERFVLVDVLSPESYGHGHLPGAVNLPFERIAEHAAGVLPEQTAEIVVYCESPT